MNSEELVAHLANYMLNARESDRLPTVRQIARLNHTSVGAVSNALTALEESGAVQIERRGHLGSFVGQRSIGKLWAVAEQEPMVISFPLIAHSRLEGLATALKKQLLEAGIDVYLIFIRGSRTRIKALRENKCHIAVMSSFAAAELCGKTEQILSTLPPESYVSRHEVFYRPNQPEPGSPLRVAIDRDSFDIEGLSELEFEGQAVEFKPVTFMQLPRLLKNDYVDAGIWSIDDMRPHLDERILHRPLSEKAAALIGEGNTSAALVARSGSSSVRAVIESTLDIRVIVQIQQMVMDGEMVPEY
jgi:hypothetical protein